MVVTKFRAESEYHQKKISFPPTHGHGVTAHTRYRPHGHGVTSRKFVEGMVSLAIVNRRSTHSACVAATKSALRLRLHAMA